MTLRITTTSLAAVAAAILGATLPAVGARHAPQPGGHGDHRPTPEGWRLAWPAGDPVKGRAVFVKLECQSCHAVRGETFAAPRDEAKLGPELAAMGALHPPEYLAEAIINPSAVIERGKGYEGPDGFSKMPSYNDAVTVQEVVDLVAYLRSLAPPAGSPTGRGGQGEHAH